MIVLRRWCITAIACGLLAGSAAASFAQAGQDGTPPGAPAQSRLTRPGRAGRLGGPPVPPNPDVMTVQDVEQYFDQVVLYQAQSQLSLTDDQFLHFGARLRALQMVRRQQERQRTMGLRELAQMINATPMDEAAVTAKLKSLDDLQTESNRQIQEAYAGLDQVLDVRQRARFRIFEENTERRKLDLLARVRQQTGAVGPAGRQGPPGGRQGPPPAR